VIEFLCPNGHRIRCQAVQVGRAAKCPRCGVKFRIPEGSPVEVEAVAADSAVSRPEFSDPAISDKKLPTAAAAPQPQTQIEFLCPNGHRLHGPTSLQGKPGQCPDCGARFRIPNYEAISAEEEAVSQISLGRVDGREGSDIGPRAITGGPAAGAPEIATPSTREVTPPAETPAAPATSPAPAATSPPPAATSPAPPAAGPPPEEGTAPATVSSRPPTASDMQALFVRLWEMRPKDAAIKLYLRDGETLVPHDFLKAISEQSRQALFTSKESDGTITLTAVAWDAVVRVSVRGLKELPKALAD
jgi:DNA-directed RNA polymerase subunit RPC12/RpoP